MSNETLAEIREQLRLAQHSLTHPYDDRTRTAIVHLLDAVRLQQAVIEDLCDKVGSIRQGVDGSLTG